MTVERREKYLRSDGAVHVCWISRNLCPIRFPLQSWIVCCFVNKTVKKRQGEFSLQLRNIGKRTSKKEEEKRKGLTEREPRGKKVTHVTPLSIYRTSVFTRSSFETSPFTNPFLLIFNVRPLSLLSLPEPSSDVLPPPRRRATMRALLHLVSLALAACAVNNAPRSAAVSSSFESSALPSSSASLSAVPSSSAPIASGSSFASTASAPPPSFSASAVSTSAASPSASQPFFNATSTIVATTLSSNASSASASLSATAVQTTVGVQPPGNPAQNHTFSPFPTATQQPVAGTCAWARRFVHCSRKLSSIVFQISSVTHARGPLQASLYQPILWIHPRPPPTLRLFLTSIRRGRPLLEKPRN